MANREAIEFALTVLAAWAAEEGGEIGGIIERAGKTYQFEIKQAEDADETRAILQRG